MKIKKDYFEKNIFIYLFCVVLDVVVLDDSMDLSTATLKIFFTTSTPGPKSLCDSVCNPLNGAAYLDIVVGLIMENKESPIIIVRKNLIIYLYL